ASCRAWRRNCASRSTGRSTYSLARIWCSSSPSARQRFRMRKSLPLRAPTFCARPDSVPGVVLMIEFGENITADPDAAASREWLETNGLGGFACSTIIGMNTRRYHALLTAATHPPVGRMVLLSKIEETLIVGDERLELGTNQYPGAAHPQGYRFLKRFRLDPFPVFTYRAGGVELEKSVFMAQGENTVVVEYRLLSKPKRKVDVSLELRPLIAFRDYHSLTHENAALNRDVREDAAGMCSVEPYNGLPRLYFGHDADALTRSGDWYRNFQYAI